MKTGFQILVLMIFNFIALLAFSEKAMASELTQQLGKQAGFQGKVAVGAVRGSLCEVQSRLTKTDGYSTIYNVAIKSKSLQFSRVFRARNYDNALAAQGSEIYIRNSRTKQVSKKIQTDEKLHLYHSDDGSLNLIIYKGHQVLLSCTNLK